MKRCWALVTRAVRWEGPKGPRTGRVELPQFGDECLLFGGCSATVWVCL